MFLDFDKYKNVIKQRVATINCVLIFDVKL